MGEDGGRGGKVGKRRGGKREWYMLARQHIRSQRQRYTG